MGVGAKIESWIMPSLKRFLNTMDYSSRITKSDYLLERIFFSSLYIRLRLSNPLLFDCLFLLQGYVYHNYKDAAKSKAFARVADDLLKFYVRQIRV